MGKTASHVSPLDSVFPLGLELPRGTALSPTGLGLVGELEFVDWERLGDFLFGVDQAVGWWLGDWWAYGDHLYGDRAKAAVESRFDYKYLANLGWVARSVEPSRRREDLSVGHHQCVANLAPDQQSEWLAQAAANRLSVKGLRRALKQGLIVPAGADDVPPLPDHPDSLPNTLYQLGPHRLYCGDASDPAALLSLCGDEQAAIIWTDPPYGVDYVGKTAAALTISNDGAPGLAALLAEAWAAATPVLRPNAALYIAGPTGTNASVFTNSIEEAGWRYKQQLTWVKNTIVLGHQDYQQRDEAIYYGSAGTELVGRRPGGLNKLWYGGDDQESTFFVDKPAASREHPTMKPVELIIPHLLNSSMPNEIVLDPFAGSGSTMVAAHLTGRRAFMIELDPKYADVIRERWLTLEPTELVAAELEQVA